MRKKIISGILLSTLLFANFTIVRAESMKEFYVDSKVEQSGDGTKQSPFKTIKEAQEAVRKLIKSNYPENGITVYLREGEYKVTESIDFRAEDSGKEGAPVVWRSYPLEEVNLVGGTEIKLGDCKIAETGAFPDSVKGKIYSYNLFDNGVEPYDKLNCIGHSHYYLSQIYPQEVIQDGPSNPEVFYNNEPTTLARFPNGKDYIKTGKVNAAKSYMENPGKDINDFYTPETIPPLDEIKTMAFKVDIPSDQLERWKNEPALELRGYWYFDWSDVTTPVKEIDLENAEIITKYPGPHTIKEGQRFFAFNALCELDAPGEWYLDKQTGEFYIYPKDTNKDSKILMSFSIEDIITVQHCNNIEIRDLNIMGTRGFGIHMSNSSDIKIFGCTVSNVANCGVSVYACKDILVDSCHIFNTGKDATILNGGDFETLEPANIVMRNCWIHDFGRINTSYAGACTLSGVGVTMQYNTCHSGPHFGVGFSGADNVIEYNDFYDVMKETADVGVLYVGKNMLHRGVQIRGNVFHDCYSTSNQSGRYAVYLDDCQSGYNVEQNLIYNMDGIGVMINGGRDNTVTDNIIINTAGGVLLQPTGLAVNWGYGLDYLPKVRIVPGGLHTTAPYAKYPHLADILEDDNPMAPKYNVIKDNITCNVPAPLILNTLTDAGTNATEKQLREWSELSEGLAVNTEVFADPANENYNIVKDLSEELPGFDKFDFNKAGLITSRLRHELSEDAVVLAIGKYMSYSNWEKKFIDEDNFDIVPQIKNDLTYVPIRFLAEMLNSEVGFNDGVVSIDYNGSKLELVTGSNKARIDGEDVELSGEVFIENDRTYVPLRSCSELFNKQVFWDDRGLIVVSSKDMTEILDDAMIENLIERLK